MSDKIEIDILINTSESAGSVNELKASLKDLRNAAAEAGQGSEDFDKLSKAAGEVKNKIDDVNASIKSQSGEGIEKITGSFGLLGDKLKALDFKGAASAAKGFAGNISAIDLKSLTSGIGSFVSSLGTLGKALLANQFILLATAVVGLITVLSQLPASFAEGEDAMKDAAKSIDEVRTSISKLRTDLYGLQLDNKVLNKEITQGAADGLKAQRDALESIGETRKEQAEKAKKINEDFEKAREADGFKATKNILDAIGVETDATAAKNKALADLNKEYDYKRSLLLKIEQEKVKKGIITDQKDKEKAAAELEKLAKDKNTKIAKINDDSQKRADAKALADANDTRAAIEKETQYRIESLKGTDQEEKRIAIESIETRKRLGTATREEIDALADYEKNALDKSVQDQRDANDQKLAIEKTHTDDRINSLQLKSDKLARQHKNNDKTEKQILKEKYDAGLISEQEYQDGIAKIDEAANKKRLENASKIIGIANDLAQGVNGIFEESAKHQKYLLDQEAQDQNNALNTEYQQKIDNAEKSGQDTSGIEAEYKKQKQALDIANEAKANELAKKAFKRNKALSLASAITSGAQAVLSSLATGGGVPAGIPLAIAAGALAALNIGKILATKFEGESGAANVDAPSAGSGGGGTSNNFQPPSLNLFKNQPAGGNAKPEPIRAYVVSENITDAQNKDELIKRRSTY